MVGVLKKEEFVSIIMPAYNAGKYIRDAINSVISQSYLCWELIVIDDASKDDTVKIVDELCEIDNRIRFYKSEVNQGVSASRNQGITLANYDWIAFLDSDDIWDATKLHKQFILAQQINAEFIFTGSSYINEEGIYYPGIFEVPKNVNYKKLRSHNVISCSSVVLKKKFFNNIKMENDEIHEDYAVWLKILKTGIIAYGINEPLLTYRISRNSKSGNKLKSIKMTYNVFKYIGINSVGSVYFMISHTFGAFIKYRNINRTKPS